TCSLSQEHARYPLSPEVLDRCQVAQLVVCKTVLLSRSVTRRYQRPLVLIWISTRPSTASDRPAFSTLHGWNAGSPVQAGARKLVPSLDPRDQGAVDSASVL